MNLKIENTLFASAVAVSLSVIACSIADRPREKLLVAASFELPSAPFLAAIHEAEDKEVRQR